MLLNSYEAFCIGFKMFLDSFYIFYDCASHTYFGHLNTNQNSVINHIFHRILLKTFLYAGFEMVLDRFYIVYGVKLINYIDLG